MPRYSKLIAGLVGFAVMIIKDQLDFDLTPQADLITDGIIAILGGIGIWGFTNAPPKKPV